jgi:pyruvate formate lyase activating enzyme
MTTTEKNISDIIGLLKELKQEEVHLLPYHKMGESKLQRVDSPLKALALEPFSDEQIAEIRERFEAAGLKVSIGGS